jgi:hypothetical protein
MQRAVLIGLVLAAATLALLVLAARSAFRHTCEVCVTFHGRTACRPASGPTAEDAVRTASGNACAFLASGMTETVECTGTAPDSATCD